jgi:hypothetical protein
MCDGKVKGVERETILVLCLLSILAIIGSYVISGSVKDPSIYTHLTYLFMVVMWLFWTYVLLKKIMWRRKFFLIMTGLYCLGHLYFGISVLTNNTQYLYFFPILPSLIIAFYGHLFSGFNFFTYYILLPYFGWPNVYISDILLTLFLSSATLIYATYGLRKHPMVSNLHIRETETQVVKTNTSKLEAQIEKLNEYLEKLEEEKRKGKISDRTYEILKNEYQLEIEKLRNEINRFKVG